MSSLPIFPQCPWNWGKGGLPPPQHMQNPEGVGGQGTELRLGARWGSQSCAEIKSRTGVGA